MSEPIPGGRLLHERDSFKQAVLSGWFRLRSSRRPVLLTVAHVLTPPSLRGDHGDPQGPLRLFDDALPVWLDEAATERPIARVLASGWIDRRRCVVSLDACIAAPVDERLATDAQDSLDEVPSIAAPSIGSVVVKLGRRGDPLRRGRVIAVDHRSRHYGASRDFLIESIDGGAFSAIGDSGSLILDCERRAIVGLHVGELRMGDRTVACVHPIESVLALFDLVSFGG